MDNKKNLGDMSPEDFRQYGYEIVDWIADYFERVEKLPVLSHAEASRSLRAACKCSNACSA